MRASFHGLIKRSLSLKSSATTTTTTRMAYIPGVSAGAGGNLGGGISSSTHQKTQRRDFFHTVAGAATTGVVGATAAAWWGYPVEPTWAAAAPAVTAAAAVEDVTTTSTAATAAQPQQQRVYQLVRAIPTFAIVDRSGVPYMVVGEDAKVTGYFFVDYDEAQRILDVARKSADQAIAEYKREKQQQQKQQSSSSSEDDDNDERLINPWKEARISTVPLDTAITLVTKAASQRGRNQYFQIAASALDIEDALQVTGKEDLLEGKVPLFYYENFTLPLSDADAAADGSKKDIIPLYFRKAQLEQAYRRANKNNKNNMELPPVKVTELFATLRAMVKEENAKGNNNNDDEDLDRLILVPPIDSIQRAEQCQRQGGSAPPFRVGERILIF